MNENTNVMISREDILLNILRILPSCTLNSPLLSRVIVDSNEFCSCCLSSSCSSVYEYCDCDQNIDQHTPNLSGENNDNEIRSREVWLDKMFNQPSVLKNDCSSTTNQVIIGMLSTCQADQIKEDKFKDIEDNVLWESSLNLICRILNNLEFENMNNDQITPHALLQTAFVSYYSDKNDVMFGKSQSIAQFKSSLSSINSEHHLYTLPTCLAMFNLRLIIVNHALRNAVKVTQQSLEELSTSIRWHRLKSMVDETLCFFQKMQLDYIKRLLLLSLQNCSNDSIHPIHIISMSTCIYVQHIFPSCRDLMVLILKNSATSSLDIHHVLETSYQCLKVFTSQVALQFILGEVKVETSHSVKIVMRCLEEPSNCAFFNSILNVGRIYLDKTGGSANFDSFNLWNSPVYRFGRGSQLIEDMLLCPSIYKLHCARHGERNVGSKCLRKQYDSDGSIEMGTQYFDTFDLTGIAILAYCKLQAQIRGDSNDIPTPYSHAYRWTLLFPSIHILLEGFHISSTFKHINEMQLLSLDDVKDVKSIALGLDMLRVMTTYTSDIRPCSQNHRSQSQVFRFPHSEKLLEQTIESLLNISFRIPMLEASTRKTNGKDEVLGYSSIQVMKLSQTLLGLYNSRKQINVVTKLCLKLRGLEQYNMLLPRVFDWLRPIITETYDNIENYQCFRHNVEENVSTANDISLLQAISNVLSPFLQDLVDGILEPKLPMSRDLLKFMSMTETYCAIFSVMRLMIIWLHRCHSLINDESRISDSKNLHFNQIREWFLQYEYKLKSFRTTLIRLIDFLSALKKSESDSSTNLGPPSNWHLLHLLSYALEDLLKEYDTTSTKKN